MDFGVSAGFFVRPFSTHILEFLITRTVNATVHALSGSPPMAASSSPHASATLALGFPDDRSIQHLNYARRLDLLLARCTLIDRRMTKRTPLH